MTTRIGRIAAITLTAALALSSLTLFTGCGRMREDGATLEINMANSWRSTKLNVKQGYDPIHVWGNNILLSRYNNSKFYEKFQFLNVESGESIEFEPQSIKDRKAASNDLQCSMVIEYGDGTIGLVMCENSRNDGVVRRCIEVYDAKMNYVRTQEIPQEFADNAYLSGYVDNKGNWYIPNDGTLTTYNSSFEKYGTVPLPTGANVAEMVPGKQDGTMYASLQKNQNGTDYYEIFEINAANRTAQSTNVFKSKSMIEKYMSSEAITFYQCNDFVNGSGEYEFCWTDIHGLYGYREGEETQLISWVNSDFPVGEVQKAYFLDNGSVIAEQGMGRNRTYHLCTPRTQEEIDSTKLISLSTLGLYTALETAVIDYNKSESGYRIVVVDYNKHNTKEDATLGAAKLREDMLDGIVADMVCTDGMHFESLANKGLFADWYDLMEADKDFRKDEYLENFFHAYEYDDKLQRLAVQYSVHTAAAKTEFAGEQEGPSLAEYTGFLTKIPQSMDFYAFYERTWFMENYLKNNMNAFVDAKHSKCYFDSPSFAAILELLGDLPTYDRLGTAWETEVPKLLPSYTEQHLAFQQNRAFIASDLFSQPIDFRAMNRLTFGDAPVTMIGIPMDYDDGNGGLFRADFTVSVNAQSEEQTAIWNFMKHLLQEEYQSSLQSSFPVHRGALDARLEETTHMVGAKEFFGVAEANIGESNPEEMGKLRTYLEGIRTAYYYNPTVYDIMMEEIGKYLSGDQTAQECGKLIQSRVSIYLSEQS